MASSVDKNSESFYNEAEISERKATYSLPLWKKIPVFLLKRLKTSVTEVNCEKWWFDESILVNLLYFDC